MKNDFPKRARSRLASANLYITASRIAILAVFFGTDKPLTHHQIVHKLGKDGIDKVTIYRTLESFCRAGLLHRAFISERVQHFELAHNCTERQCHPHFTCTNCGDTHCLTEVSVPMAKSPRRGFVINRQKVQFEGLCPQCNRSR